MMDPMLTKPKNHKAKSSWPLIIMMGLALLCFVLASQGFRTVAAILVQPV